MPAPVPAGGGAPTCPAGFNTCTSCHGTAMAMTNATAFCADTSRYSAEYCDGSTANGKKVCAHPACRGRAPFSRVPCVCHVCQHALAFVLWWTVTQINTSFFVCVVVWDITRGTF